MESIVEKIAWPFVVLTIGLVFLFLFRRQIASLLLRAKEVKVGKETTFVFGDASIDSQEQLPTTTKTATRLGTPDEARWNNSGNLFWLGHDLMWTMQTALRGGSADYLIHGLVQSLHHVEGLNLQNSSAGEKLRALLERARSTTDWDRGSRNRLASDLNLVLTELGALVEAHQPGFTPSPSGAGSTAADRLKAATKRV